MHDTKLYFEESAMLVFNPKRIFALRKIDNPHQTLVKNGFAKSSATNLLNYASRRVTIEHLEKLCVLLNCTPSDLFEWRTRTNETLDEHHALNSLKRADRSENLTEMINKIPVEKLSQVDDLLRELQSPE
jgi:DNA-binding Xre family transcriptional regulator